MNRSKKFLWKLEKNWVNVVRGVIVESCEYIGTPQFQEMGTITRWRTQEGSICGYSPWILKSELCYSRQTFDMNVPALKIRSLLLVLVPDHNNIVYWCLAHRVSRTKVQSTVGGNQRNHPSRKQCYNLKTRRRNNSIAMQSAGVWKHMISLPIRDITKRRKILFPVYQNFMTKRKTTSVESARVGTTWPLGILKTSEGFRIYKSNF